MSFLGVGDEGDFFSAIPTFLYVYRMEVLGVYQCFGSSLSIDTWVCGILFQTFSPRACPGGGVPSLYFTGFRCVCCTGRVNGCRAGGWGFFVFFRGQVFSSVSTCFCPSVSDRL